MPQLPWRRRCAQTVIGVGQVQGVLTGVQIHGRVEKGRPEGVDGLVGGHHEM